MSVRNSSHDFYWTNKKRSIQRGLYPGQSIQLRLLKEDGEDPSLQARVVGPDLAGQHTETDWYEIDPFFRGLQAWINGELIQSALPQVNRDDREFILSGMSRKDWHPTR